MAMSHSILQFLLRHGADDRLLKNIIRLTPFSITDTRLKKSMLLWKIQSQIAKGSVSEHILELLERIEELDIAATEAMKRAYCAVAVQCTVRCLGEGEEKEWEYFNAVKRVWRGRVMKMVMGESVVGLVSDELRAWKEEIESLVWESNDAERVRLKSREIDAVEAVKAYVEEAWAGLGPQNTEFATAMEGGDLNWEFLGMSRPLGEQGGEGDSIVSNSKNEKQRGVKRKHKHSEGATRSSKVKTSIKEIDMQTLRNNHGPLPMPDINVVQTVPQTSPVEVRVAVQDLRPDTSKFSDRKKTPVAALVNYSLEPKVIAEDPCSENVIALAVRNNMNGASSVEGQNTVETKFPSPSIATSVEAARTANLENGRPSQTSGLEHKEEPKVPLPGPSAAESAKDAPISGIARNNQEPMRANCSKLDVEVGNICSDTLQLPENETVNLVRESINEEPLVKEMNTVDSRSVSRCIRKTVEAVPMHDPSPENQQSNEKNCVEHKESLEATLLDSLQLSKNTKSGTIRENREQVLSAETEDWAESRPHSPIPCVEKTVEATTADGANLDPLPDASRFSKKASSGTNREPVGDRKCSSDLGAPSNCVRETAAEATREEACLHDRHCRNERNRPKPSLMERNHTCHNYEWDDSIDSSAEDLPKRENRPHLPSPKRTVVSPLKKYEAKIAGRRRVRRWSTAEEDALRAGVQKYDVGNWKLILDAYHRVFEGRTSVDLKDKWRNMVRQNAV